MILRFERFQNVATNKVVVMGEDGFLRQFSYNPQNMRHHWYRLKWPGSDDFKIIPRSSGPLRVIDAAGGQLSQSDRLQIFMGHGNQNQRWKIESTGDSNNSFFIKAGTSNMVWDVPYGSSNDGVSLQIYPFNGNDNQKWRILTTIVVDAIKIRSELDFLPGGDHLALDVPGFSQAIGTPIQLFSDNGGFNQLWEIKETPGDDDDTMQIYSISSGLVLDCPLSPAINNQPSQIGQYPNSFQLNQQWYIEEYDSPDSSGNKKVTIKSAINNFFLDVPASNHALGQRVQTYPNNGGGINQKWRIMEI